MIQKLKHRGSKIDTETIEAMGLVNKEDFS